MALDTGHCQVCACQGKACRAVIETCRRPGCRAVAHLAFNRETGTRMAGFGRDHVIGLMAREASRRSSRETGFVARIARHRTMRSGQSKSGHAVIKRCWIPPGRRVALKTVLVEIPGHVVGIDYPGEIRLMTGVTGRGRAGISGGVALAARNCLVHSGQ